MRATLFHDGVHCDAGDVESALDMCPICLATNLRRKVYQIQRSPEIFMLECPNCWGCSASYMPIPSFLDRYYGNYYQGTQHKTTTNNPQRFARRISAVAWITNRSPIRILDYGGGDGSLACAIAERLLQSRLTDRAEIHLVDYEPARSCDRSEITVYGYKELASVEGHYDLILASAVLEHIPHVNEIIRRLVALARADSYFYARTPFMIPFARLLGKIDLTFPAHVHDMGSSFWNRFIQTFDLRAELLVSRPSIVETTFTEAPLRSVAAHLLKLPSYLELSVRHPFPLDPIWRLVGGWEIMLRFRA